MTIIGGPLGYLLTHPSKPDRVMVLGDWRADLHNNYDPWNRIYRMPDGYIAIDLDAWHAATLERTESQVTEYLRNRGNE